MKVFLRCIGTGLYFGLVTMLTCYIKYKVTGSQFHPFAYLLIYIAVFLITGAMIFAAHKIFRYLKNK